MLNSMEKKLASRDGVDSQLEELEERCDQLQRALKSRIIIEQAKGAVSARCGVNPNTAFEMIRGLARRQQRDIHDFCAEVVANGGRLHGMGKGSSHGIH